MLRLLLTALFFLLALLVIFRAPTNFLWRVSVAITEFPYFFIIASMLLLIWSFWAVNFKATSMVLSFLSFTLYSLPVLNAYQKSAALQRDLIIALKTSEAKANKNQLESAFGFWKMFNGIGMENATCDAMDYNTGAERKLTLDFYAANTKTKAPCVVVIHGGSWAEGDNKQLPDLNSYLANCGYNVAAINYGLAPMCKCPVPIDDTKLAIEYLIQHSEKLRIDTNNFVLLGRSAGGQIALLTAYTCNNPNIKGVISFYAPADMVWGAHITGNPWVLNTDKVLNDYVGGSIKDVPEKYVASSPIEFVNSSSTPTLLIHGENDAMVAFEHSTRLQKKLNDNKVLNYLLNLPFATHGCDYNINGPSGQLSTYAIERFIKSVVK